MVLQRPPGATTVRANFFIPPQAPARTVRMYVDGKVAGEATYSGPGAHDLAAPVTTPRDYVTVTIEVDKTFSVPPDQRELGVLLLSVSFR